MEARMSECVNLETGLLPISRKWQKCKASWELTRSICPKSQDEQTNISQLCFFMLLLKVCFHTIDKFSTFPMSLDQLLLLRNPTIEVNYLEISRWSSGRIRTRSVEMNLTSDLAAVQKADVSKQPSAPSSSNQLSFLPNEVRASQELKHTHAEQMSRLNIKHQTECDLLEDLRWAASNVLDVSSESVLCWRNSRQTNSRTANLTCWLAVEATSSFLLLWRVFSSETVEARSPVWERNRKLWWRRGRRRSSQEVEQMFGTEVEPESSPGMCENMMNVSAAQQHWPAS